MFVLPVKYVVNIYQLLPTGGTKPNEPWVLHEETPTNRYRNPCSRCETHWWFWFGLPIITIQAPCMITEGTPPWAQVRVPHHPVSRTLTRAPSDQVRPAHDLHTGSESHQGHHARRRVLYAVVPVLSHVGDPNRSQCHDLGRGVCGPCGHQRMWLTQVTVV